MASDFFDRRRECRFYTAGCGNKMAVSVTGPRAVNVAQSYRVQEALVRDNIKGLTKIQNNNICLCLAFKILNKFISCNQKLAFA